MPVSPTLKVNECFTSIQGEGYWTGTPAFFIRLSGCNRNCLWCDTNHEEGAILYVKDIIDQISPQYGHVVITGGEPTMQPTVVDLVHSLDLNTTKVHIETNGDFYDVLYELYCTHNTWLTVSPKGTVVTASWYLANELKFVIADREDLIFVDSCYRFMLHELGNRQKLPYFFLQPVSLDQEATALCVIRCLKYPDRYRLSLQTHKLIGIE